MPKVKNMLQNIPRLRKGKEFFILDTRCTRSWKEFVSRLLSISATSTF